MGNYRPAGGGIGHCGRAADGWNPRTRGRRLHWRVQRRSSVIALSAVIAACLTIGVFGAVNAIESGPPPNQKGVGTWEFTGVKEALARSGAKWYYDWSATPGTIVAPKTVGFVPMIWGASDVTSTTLNEAKGEGSILLGFNEPDNASQSNMTVQQALDLWPQLMATGMTLGSPAVTSNAARPGGWLDQFMAGVAARGYRVNFITVHWYGSDFDTATAVQQLHAYLQAVYDKYHLPIWLTEFALADFTGPTATFPSETQQADFLTAATAMLAGLSYVQRYAWFALSTSSVSGTAGLFDDGPVATAVGDAFKTAP
jgi:Glycosyl hydrolase catalytic core